MNIKRIVPNIQTTRPDETRRFFQEFLGMDVAMDMDWIVTLASPVNPMAQVSVLANQDNTIDQTVSLTIEVDDVDAVYSRAKTNGLDITYPLTQEPWGVRRFHVLDPNGLTINVMCHMNSEGGIKYDERERY